MWVGFSGEVLIIKKVSVLLGCPFPGPFSRDNKLLLFMPISISGLGLLQHPIPGCIGGKRKTQRTCCTQLLAKS